MIELDIYNKTKTRFAKNIFEPLAQQAWTILRKEKTIRPNQRFLIELTFVGNKKITELNAQYHKKNRPTDVISLSFFEDYGVGSFVGEIFICVPYARSQAKKIGQSLTQELRFLFVHGLLHIFGYDHMKPKEEVEMLQLTYAILGRKK